MKEPDISNLRRICLGPKFEKVQSTMARKMCQSLWQWESRLGLLGIPHMSTDGDTGWRMLAFSWLSFLL